LSVPWLPYVAIGLFHRILVLWLEIQAENLHAGTMAMSLSDHDHTPDRAVNPLPKFANTILPLA
jgi:hypothetical protein